MVRTPPAPEFLKRIECLGCGPRRLVTGRTDTNNRLVPAEEARRAPPGIDPELRDHLHAVYAFGEEHADAFGGAIASGHSIFVGLVRRPGEYLEALRQRLPGVIVKGFLARNSYADLRKTIQRIPSDLGQLQTEGIRIVGVGMDERDNRVRVDLVESNPDWIRALGDRYGEEKLSFRVSGWAHPMTDGQA